MARRPVDSVAPYSLLTLAGGFPGGLNTEDAAYDLKPDETPDGYGYSIDLDGRLAKSTTMPTGTARIARAYTITSGPPAWVANTAYTVGDVRVSSNVLYYCITANSDATFTAAKWKVFTGWRWHYQRLWGYVEQDLFYGALKYDDRYVPQGFGRLIFDEDASATQASQADIITIVPFGSDNMCIVKSTGSYAIGNLNDTRAFFTRTPLVQEFYATVAANVTELDGAVFASNGAGLYAFDGNKTYELTRKVRDSVTSLSFINKALTVDYTKKRIVAGTTSGFVFDMAMQKLFRWNSTGFRYTTRQMKLPDDNIFTVDGLWFHVEHSTTADGYLKYQTKFEDREWSQEKEVPLRAEAGKYSEVPSQFDPRFQGRKMQVRITDLSTNKYIKEIRLDAKAQQFFNYSV